MLNSSLELTRRLVSAGHRVSYVSHADLHAVMTANQRVFHQLTHDPDFEAELRELPPPWKRPGPWGIRALVQWYRARRRLRARSAQLGSFEALLKELEPDMVIIDIELHAAVITTISMGFPLAMVSPWFSLFRDAKLPPMDCELLPGHRWSDRARIQRAWAVTNVDRLRREWRSRLRRSGLASYLQPVRFNTQWIDNLKAVARARRIDLAAEADRTQWLRPLVFTRLPILALNIRELEFPHTPPPNLHYVGAMVARERKEAVHDEESHRRWADLKARRAAQPGRPLVYCSLGSYWSTDQAFLQRVLTAFEREPEWDLVIGLGGKLAPEALGPTRSGVLLLRWAPQLDVIASADCCLNHGGIGTINECATYGVPMVVYSTSHVDQDGCAARVHWHRLGIRADKNADGPDDIRRNIRHVLNDPVIRHNLGVIRERLLQVERDNLALEIIERVRTGRHGATQSARVE
jgi:hypothetical protein